ncbi:MAG: alpha-2-macroglobulin family protein [Flavisolibacter sp.]
MQDFKKLLFLFIHIYFFNSTIYSQTLKVQPNMPRFLRQGDHIELSTKIVNLSDTELTGQVQLQLFDAATNQSVDGWFMNTFPNQYFTVAARQSEAVKFPIQVPFLFNSSLIWKVMAVTNSSALSLSDGEQDALPVLSNKILITESLPVLMRGSGTKSLAFDKLLSSENSESLQNHSLTVEYTSNPAWYAIQALPYLMEFPYECTEQTWNRFYSNALATTIINSSSRIKQVVGQWRNHDTSAFLSELQKNQELKSILLEETPWVLEAKSEEQQKKNIALLFDLVRLKNELAANLEKLKGMQLYNGAFAWFKGGPEDRFITQYIISGIGHLRKLSGIPENQVGEMNAIVKSGINYLDNKLKEDYDLSLKRKKLDTREINYLQIQYFYMRSFFPEYTISKKIKTAHNFYFKQLTKIWDKQNKYMQGMIALTLYRSGDFKTSKDIINSLKETAIIGEESGMYWKEDKMNYKWLWWNAPIESQSLLIEAFNEISQDVKTVDELKTWLILNKQTNHWSTTKATADACYALLLTGNNWINQEPLVQIKLGPAIIINNKDQKTEAGTAYLKYTFDANAIKPEMGNIAITVNQNGSMPTWGAVYWQYFEDMDKIKESNTPLQLEKKLFIEKNSDTGPVLLPVNEGQELQVGDKVKVRIVIRVDRDMEYVHLKDSRVSGFEPVNVLSEYKYQGGLGYYQTTKDASSDFFFNYIPKGTYVFEYPLFVSHSGNFTNGPATIQCMYAPQFIAHSTGERIDIEE